MSREIILPHHHHDGDEAARIIEHMPGDDAVSSTAAALKQIGDPTRLKIFWLLCHTEECVIDIAAIVNMSSPAVAHHLRLLKDAGLVTTRREGKEMYYRAAETPIVSVLHHTIEDVMEITCPD